MPTRFTKKHIDRCVESATYQKAGSLKLDRDAGVVYGVKVLGWSGKGGQRIYQRRAIETALPLYDGAVVNLNHAAKDSDTDFSIPNRSVTDRFGRIVNPRITDDGLFADLKYNRKHYWAETFTGWVEDDPGAIGLSHDAILQGPLQSDGKRSIESIPKVFSVDIVADPGSTKGLHENMSPEPDEEHTDASMDMDDLDNPSDDADEHLCSYIVSILKDKSLSMEDRRKKVMDAMDMMDDDGEYGSEDDESESEPEEKSDEKPKMSKEETPSKESMALTDAERVELDDFRREKTRREQESKAKQQCEIADLEPSLVTPVFINMLTRAQESEWENIIADRKLQAGTSEPVSTPPTGGKKKVGIEDFEKHMLGDK